jgi:hypothetical protein
VLSIQMVHNVTPKKEVRWAEVGWIGRPSSGSLWPQDRTSFGWNFGYVIDTPQRTSACVLLLHPCHTVKLHKPLDRFCPLLRSQCHFEMFATVVPHLSVNIYHSFPCLKKN